MDDLPGARHVRHVSELDPLHVAYDGASHGFAPCHVSVDDGDDGTRADPAVRALLPRAPRRGARLPETVARSACRGRVAGDLPARAPRVRPAPARPQPPR